MATIEERAIQFADATPDAPTKFVANKAYTRGATDQRDIDIKLACDAFCSHHCRPYGYMHHGNVCLTCPARDHFEGTLKELIKEEEAKK